MKFNNCVSNAFQNLLFYTHYYFIITYSWDIVGWWWNDCSSSRGEREEKKKNTNDVSENWVTVSIFVYPAVRWIQYWEKL